MRDEQTISHIKSKYQSLRLVLNERSRRLWAATEAKSLGHGGQTLVVAATGLSRRTIYAGLQELEHLSDVPIEAGKKIRCSGGGRKQLTDHDGSLLDALEALVEPTSRGDPESPLRWTCKSIRKLAEELTQQGYGVGYRKVAYLLKSQHYSLQGTRKVKEGGNHTDRNAQFEYINDNVKSFQERGEPVISVDAKKKEKVGDFSNKGQEWRPKGEPELVRVYDFVDEELGKVTPYGVYDQTANVGWVSVGTDHDTAAFAVESIRRWWRHMGHFYYPRATKLLITADGGGSNGSRNRLWKLMIQQLADDINLHIVVCHFPPGTSKWNKIEHRMFSHISINWRGRALTSHETIVSLISNTTTRKGLSIKTELDKSSYPTGIKISNEEMAKINIAKAPFHGNWNYSISPHTA